MFYKILYENTYIVDIFTRLFYYLLGVNFMQLKVLGKYGPYSINGNTSSYIILDKIGNVLLDCGSGATKKILSNNYLENLKFIVLTHLHFDHISDIGVLSYAINFSSLKRKIKLYLPKEDSDIYRLISSINCFEIVNIEESKIYFEDGYTFSFYKMSHPVLCYGIKISNGEKSFAYSGDTTLNDNIKNLVNGVSLALLDGAFLQKDYAQGKPHMSVKQVCEVSSLYNVKTILTHLSPNYLDDEVKLECEKFSKNVIVAKEEEIYEI